MFEQSQAELASALWRHSRDAAQQAHEAWWMVLMSQKAVLDSMKSTGVPFALAAAQFEKLMEFHAGQHKAALDYMEKVSAEYEKLVARQA